MNDGAAPLTLVPIGRVESPLTDRAQAPKQGHEGAPDAWIVFEAAVADAIRDIEPGAEVIVLTWFDRARRDVLVTRPRDDPAADSAFGVREFGRPIATLACAPIRARHT